MFKRRISHWKSHKRRLGGRATSAPGKIAHPRQDRTHTSSVAPMDPLVVVAFLLVIKSSFGVLVRMVGNVVVQGGAFQSADDVAILLENSGDISFVDCIVQVCEWWICWD